jgi:S-adenosylmethionine:tRNA ribosyltransferase-isomerase
MITPPDHLFDLQSYDYELPSENIAQKPAARRDQSRLLVLDRRTGLTFDRKFPDLLEYLTPGDLLVLNDTRVFPARLLGNKDSGGKAELLLLEYPQAFDSPAETWQQAIATGLVRSSKRPRPGSLIHICDQLQAKVEELFADGKVKMRLLYRGDLHNLLELHGRIPLPPYIKREDGDSPADRQRYQTVYSSTPGAVAAPTAGLHLTETLLNTIVRKGVEIARVTLHVGYGTFAPVRTEDIRRHQIHAESFIISDHAANLVNKTREAGGKIVAVGTTTVRCLEFAADPQGRLQPGAGLCNLYIYPGYEFRIVDSLVTNFHLPRSSLLFMVSALAGKESILAGYRQAIAMDYRFYSYGDAMLIL